jgi:hypothetical protein
MQRKRNWVLVFVLALIIGGSLLEALQTTIIESTATIAHPKITEAPLYRRKLGSNKWDLIHDEIQGQKRDAKICPADYQSCPQSVYGGCCPVGRICGTSSCLASTSTTVAGIACALAGYIACGIDEGGAY